MAAPKTTRLSGNDDVDKPQTTDPGDAPADTWSETERAASVEFDSATAAANGDQTVNTVNYVGDVPAPVLTGERTEAYTVYLPDGTTGVRVHNYDTGLIVEPLEKWEDTTSYAKGDYLVLASGKILQVTTAGTSHTSGLGPAGAGAVGTTENDGTVVWTRRF